MDYKYYVNLDERGEYYADIRDGQDNTVWEVNTEGMSELIDDGFMNHKDDLSSLEAYLIEVGIFPKDSGLTKGN